MLKKSVSMVLSALMIMALSVPAFATNEDVWSDEPSIWARAEIAQAVSLGLVPEDMQNEYNKAITRQEFCRLIVGLCDAWHSAGKTETAQGIASARRLDPTQTVFSDTDDPDVSLCAALGIVDGRGNGIFDPNAAITRQEAAKMLYEAANTLTLLIVDETSHSSVPAASFPHVFSDGRLIQNWAREKINWVYHKGIMKGVSDNRFDATGTYTREQTYLTLLRLYNAYGNDELNKKPEAEYYPYGDGYIDSSGNTYTKEQKGYIYPFDKEYKVVVDSWGVGINKAHIIDKNGASLLTDEDNFHLISLIGSFATFYYDGAPISVINLKTGALYANAEVGMPSDGMSVLVVNDKYGYVDAVGDLVIEPQYKDAGKFYNGKAVVQEQDGGWALINKKGTVIKADFLDTKKYTVLSNAENRRGEYLIVKNSEGKCAVYKATEGFLTGFDYSSITICQNGQFIANNGDDWYTLLDQNGKPISKSYQNKFREVDKNCYIGFISNVPNEEFYYYYAFIDETGRELQIIKSYGEPNIRTDSGGLYIYQQDATHCIVMDCQGNTLSTIEREYHIGEFGFENGLVYIENLGGQPNKEGKPDPEPLDPAYYLPNGTLVFYEPNTYLPRHHRLNGYTE